MAESKDTFYIKAEELMVKAAKKEKGTFFGNLVAGKGERLEEACELYKQAATNYKLAKQC